MRKCLSISLLLPLFAAGCIPVGVKGTSRIAAIPEAATASVRDAPLIQIKWTRANCFSLCVERTCDQSPHPFFARKGSSSGTVTDEKFS
jgi:hypothetical protein